MFGGGEEYFREPDPIDRDTLRRFAIFCSKIRALEKPSVKQISDVCTKAREVGESILAIELVLGAIMRHIKVWKGTKQLCCWYVLDKLCKEGRETFGFAAQPYVAELAADFIPFENADLVDKYDRMLERWDCVFARHVIDRIWIGKKERLWAVAHPEEVEAARKEEELEWQREELRQQDQEGLDNYGQPCMDYLQGRCMWGSECKQLHPPGLEGTLPLECRLGDWKCRCGVINRHFRRRCSQCVREKPQYRKEYEEAPEVKLLSAPDPIIDDILRSQFGYNPMSEVEAVAHWSRRLHGVSRDQYIQERRAAIRTRIFGRKPSTKLEEQVGSQINFGEVKVGRLVSLQQQQGSNNDEFQPAAKRSRVESLVPEGLSPSESITVLCKIVLERGAHDTNIPLCLCQICTLLKSLNQSNTTLDLLQAETFSQMSRLIFSSWNTTKSAHTELFFVDIKPRLSSIGLTKQQQAQLGAMCNAVMAAVRTD